MTEPTIPSQPSPASLVIHRLALSPVLTVCVIFGALSLSQEVAAGTESFRRSCTNIRVSQMNGRHFQSHAYHDVALSLRLNIGGAHVSAETQSRRYNV